MVSRFQKVFLSNGSQNRMNLQLQVQIGKEGFVALYLGGKRSEQRCREVALT